MMPVDGGAYAHQWLEDISTELVARQLSPDSWVEPYPHGVFDAGAVGGDIQSGDAWTRRFVWFDSSTGMWWVINDSYYLCECDHAAEDRGNDPGRCAYCGPLTWIQNQTEYIFCRDFRDPGGTEEYADYEYNNSIVDFDWQVTDRYAKQCAAELNVDCYGTPGRRR